MSVGSIAAKGRRAGQSPWVERLGRAGLVAQGVLYGVIGILAAKVALGGREESPDKQGALREIAQQPFGKGLLAVLAVGFAAYALWRLAQAILDRDNEGEGAKGLAKRAGSLGAGGLVRRRSAGSRREDRRRRRLAAATSRRRPAACSSCRSAAGSCCAVGLAFLGAAAFNGYRAVTCKFEKKLKKGEMSDVEEAGATGVGILGHLARGVVFGLVGAFLVKAAWEYDPKEARGLDGALLELSQQPYGGLLLGAVSRRPDRVRALLLRAGALPAGSRRLRSWRR